MAKRRYIRKTEKEKLALAQLSAMSCLSESTIEEVLLSILMLATNNCYDNYDQFNLVIPYIGELNLDIKERQCTEGVVLAIDIDGTPYNALIDEVLAISNGEETPTKKNIKSKLSSKLEEGLS